MYDFSRALMLLPVLLVAPLCLAQDTGDSFLEAAMGQEHFEKAGLDKLSAKELAELERWVISRSAPLPSGGPVALPPRPGGSAGPPVKPAVAETREPISAPQPVATTNQEEEFGLRRPAKRETIDSIKSRIDGEFRGWTGKTIFKLQNGQVWIQRIRGKSFMRLNNPEVMITRNILGYYKITVVETGRSIGVKRIK